MKARDIMTAQPESVTPSEPLQRAAEIMRERDVGFVPIVSDRTTMELKGVITDRDIAIRHVAAGHANDCRVQDHMTGAGIESVQPDANLDAVREVMKRAQVRRVPVVDERGGILGVIAQAEIAVHEADVHPREVADTVEKISEPATPHPNPGSNPGA